MNNKLEYRTAAPVSNLMQRTLSNMGLLRGLNVHLVYDAWDKVSGAAGCTIRKSYRAGCLRVTVSSSVLRSRLSLRKQEIMSEMNALLRLEEFFVPDDSEVGEVREIVLK